MSSTSPPKPARLPATTTTRSPWRRWERRLNAAGVALLVAWAAFWAQSVAQFALVGGVDGWVWFLAWPFLGLDFLHVYYAAAMWVGGDNPYLHDFGDWRGTFAYPPIVLPLYAWTTLFDPQVAAGLWAALVAGSVGLAWRGAARARRAMGLLRLPFWLVLAVLLWSTPTLFAMERGNGDALVLMLLLATCALIRRPPAGEVAGARPAWRGWLRDAGAGACVAVAAWVKVYPVALLLGLPLLRRTRAAVFGLVFATLIPLAWLDGTRLWLANAHRTQGERMGLVQSTVDWLRGRPSAHDAYREYGAIEWSSHSLSHYWRQLWTDVGVPWLAGMPGLFGAALVLGPPVAWVSWRVWRARGRAGGGSGSGEALAPAYLFWLVAAATFGMPVSYDYNLFFLPLAAAAAWDRRDPWLVHVLMAASLLFLQPLRIEFVPPAVLFAVKFATLLGVGVCVAWRADESAARAGPVAPA